MEGERLSARLTATDEESLKRVAGQLHDAWLDAREIRREESVVSIPLALRGVRVKKRLLPGYSRAPSSYESLLTVRGVRALAVDEPEQIAVSMIEDLVFAPPRLTIAAVPTTLTFDVSELDVECDLWMEPYEWEAPGATALVVPFRAAEPAIGEHRRAHTPSGREGMPAHATLLAPFVHSSRLDSSDRYRIRDTIRRFTTFDVRLGSFGRFEDIGCLYLEPEPTKPLVAMSEALLDLYPEIEYPPAGATEIVPHVTIGGHLTDAQQHEIKDELAPHLPIRARAEGAILYERGKDGRWFSRETFPLS